MDVAVDVDVDVNAEADVSIRLKRGGWARTSACIWSRNRPSWMMLTSSNCLTCGANGSFSGSSNSSGLCQS